MFVGSRGDCRLISAQLPEVALRLLVASVGSAAETFYSLLPVARHVEGAAEGVLCTAVVLNRAEEL